MVNLTVFVVVFAAVAFMFMFVPKWWIGVVIFLAAATLPTFVPTQIPISGVGLYLHELPAVAAAAYLLLFAPYPARRSTDWLAAGIGALTAIYLACGYLSGYPLADVANDGRALIGMAMAVFIAGRVIGTELAPIAAKAVALTLWVSFVFVALGASRLVSINATAEDAALNLGSRQGHSDVVRILGETTHLASAALCVCLGLWAVGGRNIRPTLWSYFVPALGITALGFSRNGLVLIGITMLLVPIFHWSAHTALRSAAITGIGVGVFIVVGPILAWTQDLPLFGYLQAMHGAYTDRVLDGLRPSTQQLDSSAQYRLDELAYLKQAQHSAQWLGHGFGFHYRPPQGTGFAATSGTYYAHHFYWWALVKVGWFGLLTYMAMFLAPIAHAMFGGGRTAIRSAAAAVAAGFLVTSTVAPIPESVNGAPVFGALLALCFIRVPSRIASEPIQARGGEPAART